MPLKDKTAYKKYRAEYYQKNKTAILAYAEKYRAEHAKAISATKKRIYHERYKIDPEYTSAMSVYGKKRRMENLEHVKAIEKRSRERHAERLREYNRKQIGTLKRLARQAVTRATSTNRIPNIKTLNCSACGRQANEYHHNKGYEKKHWLDVVPMCHRCHKNHHVTSCST